jgi:hypothetical protein
MIDARISVGLPSHPKTKKLIRRIGSNGAWRLVCLFLWAASNKPNGDLSGMSAEDIELAIDWDGVEGLFVSSLIDVGFMEMNDGQYLIHDWEEHNPWAAGAEARSTKAKFAALCKQHGRKMAAELMPEYASSIGFDASSTPPSKHDPASSLAQAVPDTASSSASSTLVDKSSSAPSPSPSPSPKRTTDTDVSGGEPPKMSADEIIFTYGIPLLTNSGTPEKQARSFLGGLRKHHGDAAVIDKLRACIKAKPLQPLEWLAASIPPNGSPKKSGRVPEAENFNEVNYGTGGAL